MSEQAKIASLQEKIVEMRSRGRKLTYGAFIFTVLAAFFLSTYILSIVVKFGLGLGVVCMVMAVVCIATKYLSDKEKDGYIKELNEMTTAIQQQGALVKCKKVSQTDIEP